jgi:hypothetical protein
MIFLILGAGIPKERLSEVFTKVGNIWKKMGHNRNSCAELISEIRNYILLTPPYNAPYICGSDTPLKWWNTCFSLNNQLQTLAIKLFSITPHAASCERIWSSVSWIYGKRRTQLSFETIESLTKVYRFYMGNTKQELLNYHQHQVINDDEEIIQMVNESLAESYEEVTLEDDEEQILSSLRSPDTTINTNEEEVLDISLEFNLQPIVLIEYVDVSQFNNESENESEIEDFDMDSLVNEVIG